MIALANVASAKLLSSPVEELTLAEQVSAHVMLRALCEASETRMAEVKDSLSVYVEAKGEAEGKKGTKAITILESKVSLEKRTASLPDYNGLLTLLEAKGLHVSDALDEVKTLKINPSKIAFLVATGKVKEEEINALRPVVPALRIYPSAALEEAIEPLKALAGKGEE
jgi:hypothetical protein